MKKFILIILLTSFCYAAFSQRGMRWKRTRYELMGGVGIAGFMGDLGGGKNPDSELARNFGDFDLQASRPAIWGGMRYKLSPSFALKANLVFGQVSGDDRWSAHEGRKSRNLNFRSPLFEQTLQVEYSIIKESNARKWNRRRKRRVRGASINLYTFAGVGGVYFNPKGENQYGDWIKLRPLGTEGQTTAGRKPYGLYTVTVPGGLGLKVGLNRKWDICAEYGFRYTFTDYIDDVGTSYFDNKAIVEANGGGQAGATAGWMADKHIASGNSGTFGTNVNSPNHPYYGVYSPGDRIPYENGSSFRGGDANDVYMFFLVGLSYKMKTKRNGLPKF